MQSLTVLAAPFLAAALVLGSGTARGDEDQDALRARASEALRRAVRFFREEVSTEGGYLWRYSADLSSREGEGRATATQIWIQPPGTPAVGMAFLQAWRATGAAFYLDAARDAARALVRTQLRSGGWTHQADFDPQARRRHAYRVDPPAQRQRNWSTLDDDTTQSALRFLMETDAAIEFKDQPIHEAAAFGLGALLAAQHQNGGFPQAYQGPAEPDRHPLRKAEFPDSWPRDHPAGHDYWVFYTLNDGLLETVVETLRTAERIYRDPKYREAARRAGNFIVLAQLPDPQPGWAQQYDFEMHPVWARKFEPPSVTGGEAQGVLRTLLALAEWTGDRKYLDPVPRALEYYRRSLLPDGRLARFYELRTNRPLYLTRDYRLTHDDGDLPTHYAFKVESRLESIVRDYQRIKASSSAGPLRETPAAAVPRPTAELAARARAAAASLDEKGRWVEPGRLKTAPEVERVIDCRTFIKNCEALSRYLAATRP